MLARAWTLNWTTKWRTAKQIRLHAMALSFHLSQRLKIPNAALDTHKSMDCHCHCRCRCRCSLERIPQLHYQNHCRHGWTTATASKTLTLPHSSASVLSCLRFWALQIYSVFVRQCEMQTEEKLWDTHFKCQCSNAQCKHHCSKARGWELMRDRLVSRNKDCWLLMAAQFNKDWFCLCPNNWADKIMA